MTGNDPVNGTLNGTFSGTINEKQKDVLDIITATPEVQAQAIIDRRCLRRG